MTMVRGRKPARRPLIRCVFAVLLTGAAMVAPACCATVELTNGTRLTAQQVWRQGDEIKCLLNGIVLGFPAAQVLRIDPPLTVAGEIAPRSHPADAPPPETAWRRLRETHAALTRERSVLAAALRDLERDRSQADAPERIAAFNRRTLALQGRIDDFNRRHEAFRIRLRRYLADHATVDAARLLHALKALVGSPITEVIQRWGAPDFQAVGRHGRQVYLFSIAAAGPHQRLTVAFDIDPHGIVTDCRVVP